MNSMPQHERPRGSGQTEFLRHQLAIDCSVERRKPPSVEPVAETTSVLAVVSAISGFLRLPIPKSLRSTGPPGGPSSVLRPVHGAAPHHIPPTEEEDAREDDHLGQEEHG